MKKIKTLKGASGLGDSIYIRQVAQYLYSQDKSQFFLIMSDFPSLFQDIPCHVVRHQKTNFIEYQGNKYPVSKISYCKNKYRSDTTQFQDVLAAAGVPKDIPYELKWQVRNEKLINGLKKSARRKGGKPICLVTAPYKPFGRADDWGKEMTVDFTCMQSLITSKRNDYYFVQTCKDKPIFELNNIDSNLAKKTTVSDLIDIASVSSVIIGQIGHGLPLAESFNKPALIFFSKNGLTCGNAFLEAITPQKVIHKKELVKYVIDDWSDEHIRKEFDSLK